MELEKSLAASEEKLADLERRIQKLEYNEDTVDGMATKVDEFEANFRRTCRFPQR